MKTDKESEWVPLNGLYDVLYATPAGDVRLKLGEDSKDSKDFIKMHVEENQIDENVKQEHKTRNRINKESANKVDNYVKKRGRGSKKLWRLSPQLQKVVGAPELARTEVAKRNCDYIRGKNLQNPRDKQNILCDETLRALFQCKSFKMFHMKKLLSRHIWPREDFASDEPKQKRRKGGSSSFLSPPPSDEYKDKDVDLYAETSVNDVGDVSGQWREISFLAPCPSDEYDEGNADLHLDTSANEAHGDEVDVEPVGGNHKEVLHDELRVDDIENDIEEAPARGVVVTVGSDKGTVGVSSSKPGMSLWEGHLVLESYIDLFSHMSREHPETFLNFEFRSAAARTSALNTLGEFYVSFASKPVAAMGVDDITHFRDMFTDLEVSKFDVGWLQERIDRIEELRFKSPVAGELVELRRRTETTERDLVELKKELARREEELAELKVLLDAKAEEVWAAHGYLGENMTTWNATDGLLGGWPNREDVPR